MGAVAFEDRNDVDRWLQDPEGMPVRIVSGRLRGVEAHEMVRVIDTRSSGVFDTLWAQVRRMHGSSVTLWVRHDCLNR
jgi:hypothetical protein